MAGTAGKLIYIYGIVQGVGFRPFAARLAEKYGITGHVKNRGGFVEILAAPRAAGSDALRLFLHDLSCCSLPGSRVLHIDEFDTQVEASNFEILPSSVDENSPVMLPPDFATCDACMAELKDPANRRFNYPFISCTACGARYSIIRSVPYDRETTSMNELPICNACSEEYADAGNARHWAQTVCCHDCGPELIFGNLRGANALDAAAQVIARGGILAVKGVGGYHLACSPFDEVPLSHMRSGKRREEKPFAVMFPNIDVLREYCATDSKTEELLTSSARPIVLLKPGAKALHPLASRNSAYVGAFLPSSAHQALLLEKCGPLVMTSGNLSGTPIATHADELSYLSVDGILDHTRPIEVPLDDSVILPHSEGFSFIRRSRGYVPLPSYSPANAPDTIAMGGDLKSAFALRHGDWCYMSQHLGDLEEIKNQELYKSQLNHMTKLFGIKPERAICDLHPGYFSKQIAEESGLPVHEIQHHYAHVLSVMAEHNLTQPVIGVALDGVGYGNDGEIWGFEFLKCDRRNFTRCGHLKNISMPASDEAMRNSRRAAMCHLIGCGLEDSLFKDDAELNVLKAAQNAGINTVASSSAGRLFDAAAYLLGCGEYNHFEGQCAQALEKLASNAHDFSLEPLPLPLVEAGSGFILDSAPLFDAVLRGRNEQEKTAFRFHAALSCGILKGAERMRDAFGINAVALSGGVFQNALLLNLTCTTLRQAGFEVYRNINYPSGDGGLAMGQLAWEG